MKSKSKEEQIKYLGSKNRWALVESGVITDDEGLAKLYKTTTTSSGKKVTTRKTLKELKNDGIITISSDRIRHSVYGDFKNNGRMTGGGHCVSSRRDGDFTVTKRFSNGVTQGNVLTHTQRKKREEEHQLWFHDTWDEDKILVAGTSIANSEIPIEDDRQIGVYDGVAIRLIHNAITGKIGTVCPDLNQQAVEGVVEIE